MMRREHPKTEPTDHELLRQMARDISWIRTVVVSAFSLVVIAALVTWYNAQYPT